MAVVQSRMQSIGAALLASIAGFGCSASAAADRMIDDLLSCRSIEEEDARLRCYDSMASTLLQSREGAAASAESVIAQGADVDLGIAARREGPADARVEVAPDEAGPTRSSEEASEFGADDLRARAPREKKSEEDRVLVAGIVELATNRRGKYLVVLDNGQIWRQLSADSNSLLAPRDLTDVTAKIRRKSMGSHILSISTGRRSIRVERIK